MFYIFLYGCSSTVASDLIRVTSSLLILLIVLVRFKKGQHIVCVWIAMWVCLKIVYPLYPMVLLIIIPMKNGYFIGNINPTFSDKAMCIPLLRRVCVFDLKSKNSP